MKVNLDEKCNSKDYFSLVNYVLSFFTLFGLGEISISVFTFESIYKLFLTFWKMKSSRKCGAKNYVKAISALHIDSC